MNRLPNGCTPDQQREYNRRYRTRQARYRDWMDGIATELGMTRDQLATATNAELVACALRRSEEGV